MAIFIVIEFELFIDTGTTLSAVTKQVSELLSLLFWTKKLIHTVTKTETINILI